jgi:uncharacterized Zn-binding protein involved in type VI secretion
VSAAGAARAGDRIAHGGKLDESGATALVGVAVGAALAGGAGLVGAKMGAGLVAGARRKSAIVSLRELVGASATGAIAEGSPSTLLAGKPAALVAAQKVDCHHHRDNPLQGGALGVVVNGMRMARKGDATSCGALVLDGAETILVGGATTDSGAPGPRTLAALEDAAVTAVAMGQALAARATAIAARLGTELAGGVMAAETAIEARVTEGLDALATGAATAVRRSEEVLDDVEAGLGALFGARLVGGAG